MRKRTVSSKSSKLIEFLLAIQLLWVGALVTQIKGECTISGIPEIVHSPRSLF